MDRVDTKKLNKMLMRYSSNEQDQIKYILSNARYITLNEMFEVLDRLIMRYGQEHKVFYIYENGYKWGSENWLSEIYYEKLNSPKVLRKNIVPPDDKPHILIIDDCIHSGGNIGRTVSDIARSFYNRNCEIDIVCPYATENGCNYIKGLTRQKVNMFIGEYILDIREIVTRDGYPMDWDFFNKICYYNHTDKIEDFYVVKGRPFQKITTVWFEHKMPAFNSSISMLLLDLVEMPTFTTKDKGFKFNYFDPVNHGKRICS